MIFALLQLRKGLINLGSLSFLSPSMGLRNTATRSELDVSGAKSPTKILYSLGYCCCAVAGGWDPTPAGNAFDKGDAEVTADAQFMTKGLDELGICSGPPLPLGPFEICASTDAAWAGEGKVRKQYPGLLACWPVAGSGAGCGTLMLAGSQPMSPQTCLAYSSSIQGSSSPHQSVERTARELAAAETFWAAALGWGCLYMASGSRSLGLEEGYIAAVGVLAVAGRGGGEGRWEDWWLKERKEEVLEKVELCLFVFGPPPSCSKGEAEYRSSGRGARPSERDESYADSLVVDAVVFDVRRSCCRGAPVGAPDASFWCAALKGPSSSWSERRLLYSSPGG